MEEARQYAKLGDSKSSSVLHPEENGKKKLLEERKGTKSWKKSIFSWWKTDKIKSKPQEEPARSPSNSIPRRRLVSGPIHGSGKTIDGRHRRLASGPLTGLFNPTKRVENDIPYVCLDQLDRPQDVKTYGPLYLVT